MSTQFLFPCPNCEHPFKLETVQAGQELTCPQCKHPTEAPKLGAMKRLPTTGGAAPAIRQEGSRLKRSLFAGGLAVAMLLGGASYALYQYASSLIFDFDTMRTAELMAEETDQNSPSELLAEWNELVMEDLGEWQEHPIARYRTQGRILQKISYAMLAFAGAGMLLMIGSFFMRGP